MNKTTFKEIIMPWDPHMVAWSVQDTVDSILEHEADSGEGPEIQKYLEGVSPRELYRISAAISHNTIGLRHAIEELQSGSQEMLLDAAQTGNGPPELDSRDLDNINRGRIGRNLLGFNIHRMTMDDPDGMLVREGLLQAGPEDQERLDRAIKEAMEALETETAHYKEQLAREVLSRLQRALEDRGA